MGGFKSFKQKLVTATRSVSVTPLLLLILSQLPCRHTRKSSDSLTRRFRHIPKNEKCHKSCHFLPCILKIPLLDQGTYRSRLDKAQEKKMPAPPTSTEFLGTAQGQNLGCKSQVCQEWRQQQGGMSMNQPRHINGYHFAMIPPNRNKISLWVGIWHSNPRFLRHINPGNLSWNFKRDWNLQMDGLVRNVPCCSINVCLAQGADFTPVLSQRIQLHQHPSFWGDIWCATKRRGNEQSSKPFGTKALIWA